MPTPPRRALTPGRAAFLLALAVLYALLQAWLDRRAPGPGSALDEAFRQQASDVGVVVTARVSKVLADDKDGSRHQRFLLRAGSAPQVLVAHNIDLAPRVPLAAGDEVVVCGRYEWNEKGGVIHWTHRDPAHRHPDGWIRLAGQDYQ